MKKNLKIKALLFKTLKINLDTDCYGKGDYLNKNKERKKNAITVT